jgi:hypothetical protein
LANEPFVDQPTVIDDIADVARRVGNLFNQANGGLPNTTTRLSHALTLRIGPGQIVGAVFAFSPSQRRSIDEEWEVDAAASGLPSDIVPQALTERTIRIERYDIYTRLMEEITGTKELIVLTDQSRPFILREVWRAPYGVLTGGQRVYEYLNCWFSDLGRTVRSDDNRVVSVEATIVWGRRRRVL